MSGEDQTRWVDSSTSTRPSRDLYRGNQLMGTAWKVEELDWRWLLVGDDGEGEGPYVDQRSAEREASMAEAKLWSQETRHCVAFDAIQEFAARAADAMFDWRICQAWTGCREVEIIVEGDLTRYWTAMTRSRELLLEADPDRAEIDFVDAELRATIRCDTHRFFVRWSRWREALGLETSGEAATRSRDS